MELDTLMVGLDPSVDIHFKPGPCVVAEMKRYPSGKYSEYTTRTLDPTSLEDWIEEKGAFAGDSQPCGSVRWIFASTQATEPDAKGNYLSASETLDIAMSQECFARLSTRYHFTDLLDTWRYRATSGHASRRIFYDDQGNITSITITLSLRLTGSFTTLIATHHNLLTTQTTALSLRITPTGRTLLLHSLHAHRDLLGHALLIPTLALETTLSSNLLFMQKIQHDLSLVEKATGQHAWLNIPAAEAPAADSELSRLGHAVRIDLAVAMRRVEGVEGFLAMVRGVLEECEGEVGRGLREGFERVVERVVGSRYAQMHAYSQWVTDLEQVVRFRMVDLRYYERRAENQITAVRSPVPVHLNLHLHIYGLLAQRDNMVGISVAMESKRDGSALKSLTVLTAIFFPATYIATLFSLPTFDGMPIWVYWVVVAALTLVIFGYWSWWTGYRECQALGETIRGGDAGEGVIDIDTGRAFASSGLNPDSMATSRFLNTLRQMRVQRKGIRHS
ncbi:hypothetical protein BJY04DRAFT_222167 [Aspergillus karnatakaensis]|uniref:uncharacterized protein n=1 Tax=Aspergillus karnatakaensis TaxID=1810916 RepID=UPI003CCE4CB3